MELTGSFALNVTTREKSIKFVCVHLYFLNKFLNHHFKAFLSFSLFLYILACVVAMNFMLIHLVIATHRFNSAIQSNLLFIPHLFVLLSPIFFIHNHSSESRPS